MYQNPKSLNKLKHKDLEKKLHQLLAEFAAQCHSELNKGVYHFNLKALGECPDCTLQANLKSNITLDISHRKISKKEIN